MNGIGKVVHGSIDQYIGGSVGGSGGAWWSVWVSAPHGDAKPERRRRGFGSRSPAPQWFRTAKNRDLSTGPLACSFARSLAPLTQLFALHCSIHSCVPLG